MEWAPATVLSHLQEYINTMTHDTGLTHTGVTFAVECILCFSGQSDQVSIRKNNFYCNRGNFEKILWNEFYKISWILFESMVKNWNSVSICRESLKRGCTLYLQLSSWSWLSLPIKMLRGACVKSQQWLSIVIGSSKLNCVSLRTSKMLAAPPKQ